MTLSEQQKLLRQRGQLAQSFLESEFCQQFLLPYIYQDKNKEYPKPDEVGWEEKYRLAFAKDAVYSDLLSVIKNWVEESRQMDLYERSETDIITA